MLPVRHTAISRFATRVDGIPHVTVMDKITLRVGLCGGEGDGGRADNLRIISCLDLRVQQEDV